ncbi:hypothetical protein NM208_g13651 [Fusarium decemcellulare]|uniref:Uncharacterized protein n=1 Tax=Fusarium decemcellulare TaxID=57161 RepID=A0ACC1RKU5_9HYPO|nr:hypothetical protein NM208_g13651 [Fusarium decemcellulare]
MRTRWLEELQLDEPRQRKVQVVPGNGGMRIWMRSMAPRLMNQARTIGLILVSSPASADSPTGKSLRYARFRRSNSPFMDPDSQARTCAEPTYTHMPRERERESYPPPTRMVPRTEYTRTVLKRVGSSRWRRFPLPQWDDGIARTGTMKILHVWMLSFDHRHPLPLAFSRWRFTSVDVNPAAAFYPPNASLLRNPCSYGMRPFIPTLLGSHQVGAGSILGI